MRSRDRASNLRANLAAANSFGMRGIVASLPLAISLLISASRASSNTTCVSGFCLAPGYNRLEVPQLPTAVGVDLHILDIMTVSDKDFSVRLYGYFGIRWFEPRLYREYKNDTKYLNSLDPKLKEHFWIPNVQIMNIKSFKTVDGVRDEAGLFVVDRGRNATLEVIFIQLSEITFLCPMRFDFYPLDSHLCTLRIHTAYDTSALVYTPTKYVYNQTRRSIVLEFDTQITPINPEDLVVVTDDVGNFSTTGIEFKFTRYKLKYLFIYYFPSGLFVIISWFSFLIPPEIVAGRMSMLITLFLVLINIFTSITSSMPTAEGVTAITAWMVTCISFVCGTMCAYGYLLWSTKISTFKLMGRQSSPKNSPTVVTIQSKASKNGTIDTLENGDVDAKEKEEGADMKKDNEKSAYALARVDDACIVAFPIAFAVFNSIYWSVCLYNLPYTVDFQPLQESTQLY